MHFSLIFVSRYAKLRIACIALWHVVSECHTEFRSNRSKRNAENSYLILNGALVSLQIVALESHGGKLPLQRSDFHLIDAFLNCRRRGCDASSAASTDGGM